MGAKTDWDYHIKNYQENHSNQSVAQYARENGLNPNTARVRMKPKQLKNDRSIDDKTDRSIGKAKTKVRNPKPAPLKASRKKREPASLSAGAGQDSEKLETADRINLIDQIDRTAPVDVQIRDIESLRMAQNRGRFQPGNLMRLKNASRLDVDRLLNDVIQQTDHDWDIENPAVNIYKEELRLNLMLRLQDAAMKHREEQYKTDLLTYELQKSAYDKEVERCKKQNKDCEWLLPEEPEPLIDRLARVVFGSASHIGMAADAVARNKLKLKQLLDNGDLKSAEYSITLAKFNQERLKLAKENPTADLMARVLAMRDDEAKTAVDMAYELTVEGFEVPAIIMEECRKEIADRQPKTESGQGVTDEQIEAEIAKAAALFASQEDAIAERAEEVRQAELEDEARRAGEMLEEDDFSNNDFLIPDDEDDDIDYDPDGI